MSHRLWQNRLVATITSIIAAITPGPLQMTSRFSGVTRIDSGLTTLTNGCRHVSISWKHRDGNSDCDKGFPCHATCFEAMRERPVVLSSPVNDCNLVRPFRPVRPVRAFSAKHPTNMWPKPEGTRGRVVPCLSCQKKTSNAGLPYTETAAS